MKLEKARAISKLIGLLWKLGLLSHTKADHLIDELTVRVLKNPDNI